MTEEEINYKIRNEIIVDCYGDYEVNMGWYYFFEEALEFPFEAETVIKYRGGKVNHTKVDVLGIATEEGKFDNISEIQLEVSPKGQQIILDVGISKLENVEGSESVEEALEVWTFWKSDKA